MTDPCKVVSSRLGHVTNKTKIMQHFVAHCWCNIVLCFPLFTIISSHNLLGSDWTWVVQHFSKVVSQSIIFSILEVQVFILFYFIPICGFVS